MKPPSGALAAAALALQLAILVHSAPAASRPRRAATARLDRLWDDAVIPYEIDPIFGDDKAALFRAAMRHWENSTCIKFVERQPDEHRNFIVFTERSCGCCSFVGKRGNGAQAISIGKHCDKFGIVVHELGHVVGFWHEHTRPDRDQHVQIIGKNIMSGQEYNFNRLTKDEVNSLGLAYDYDSILHYATNTFARDTYLDTILPLHGPLNTEEVLAAASGAAPANRSAPAAASARPNQTAFEINAMVMSSDRRERDSAGAGGSSARALSAELESMLQFGGSGGGATLGPRRLRRRHAQRDADDRDSMISMDNLLARTRPEIGQRVRLSVGDIAQTNLLYKCPKCGRTVQQASGAFHAPNYYSPGSARAHEACEWRLTANAGERILLNITDLDLAAARAGLQPARVAPTGARFGLPRGAGGEAPARPRASHQPLIMSGCQADYLEVRDGYTNRAPLLARLCGHIALVRDHLRPIVSSSNRLLVSLATSPLSSGKRGFLAQHETVCGGRIVLGNAAGGLAGAEPVEADEWPPAPAPATPPASPAPPATANGSQPTRASSDLKLISNSNQSAAENEVLLSSQQQQLARTRRSSGQAASPLDLWPVVNTSAIQSPNWPEQYRASRECVWRIEAAENHHVSLRFEALDLEAHESCAYDFVEVRDGDASGELIGRFCGQRPPEQLLSSGPNLLVRFVSDSDVHRAGFAARLQAQLDECKLGTHGCGYRCSNAVAPYRCECPAGMELAADDKSCVPVCGGLRNDSAGRITSPNWPGSYPGNARCVWDIQAPPMHKVTINFSRFELEGLRGQECDYDFVDIWSRLEDGRQVRNGTYCGHAQQAFAVTSLRNWLRLEFRSDNSNERAGFEANYFVDRDECALNNGGCQHLCQNLVGSYQCACRSGFRLHENGHECLGGQCLHSVSSPEGAFQSPDFGPARLYPANRECAWTFSTAPGHRIRLAFDQFDLESHQECAYDHVAIYDGDSASDPALGRFCGSRRPLTIVSSFNRLYLVFRSDSSNERRGFNASHSSVCGGRLQASANQPELIQSHASFDGNTSYGRNEDCDWLIEAPGDGQRVRVEFTFFQLEADLHCNYDQALVFDGPDDAAPQLARLCGSLDASRDQARYVSSGESMLIVFRSDDSVGGRGFSLTYTAVEPAEEPAGGTGAQAGGSPLEALVGVAAGAWPAGRQPAAPPIEK